jgi:choline monooxygenase
MDIASVRIDPDIRKASAMPPGAYFDPGFFERVKTEVFARTWHVVADVAEVANPGYVLPRTLLAGCLDEPVLVTRDHGGVVGAVSNVCTHRAAIVCEKAGPVATLRCPYHGRRFSLDGKFLSMPEFEEAFDFPTASDDLSRVPLEAWGPLLFASLDPAHPLAALTSEMDNRLKGLPLGEARLDPGRSRDYTFEANWALYCDNYLEGFHIPFVHQKLATALDYGSYRTELFPFSSVQVGYAKDDEDSFDLPETSLDFGQRVAAFYFWLFPATMINVYPWGISLNVVEPLGPCRTRVLFRSYVWNEERLDRGAGSGLHEVEMEDEAVVESVQKGVRSRLARRGRYSPSRETGVHHFHRLLVEFLTGKG